MINDARQTARRLADGEAGLTLVEVLLAVFILSVAILALASTAIASLASVRVSKGRQDATQFASMILEEVRALPYDRVLLDTAGSVPASFEGETVLSATGGALKHVRTDYPGGRHTATTYVTDVAGRDDVRVVVVVRWSDRGTTRTVRQETFVAEARRGLPAPSFVVSQPPPGMGVTGETICLDHTLTNTGEQDGYSWQLWSTNATTGNLEKGVFLTQTVNEPDASGNVTQEMRQGFRVPSSSAGAGWFGWARMAVPETGSLQPMTDVTGDSRPDSPVRVPALRSALVRICYTPLNSSGVLVAASTDPTFTPRIHSAFDEAVTTETQGNEITNDLQVVSANTTLYLHEVSSDPKTMNTSTAVRSDGDDYDGDTIPGLRVDTPPTLWDYQLPSAGQVSDPVATFWVRTDGLDEDSLVLNVTLQHLSGGTATTLANAQVTRTVSDGQWTMIQVGLPLAAPVNVLSGDYLRLGIACDAQSTGACHVHYDAPSFPSRLDVEVQ